MDLSDKDYVVGGVIPYDLPEPLKRRPLSERHLDE